MVLPALRNDTSTVSWRADDRSGGLGCIGRGSIAIGFRDWLCHNQTGCLALEQVPAGMIEISIRVRKQVF
jgi:hypothetical protein